MPLKAEHVSFQGKKKFWKSEQGSRSYSSFSEASPILSARIMTCYVVNQTSVTFKNSNIDDANLFATLLFLNRFSILLFFTESGHFKLSERTNIFGIGGETNELRPKNCSAWTNLSTCFDYQNFFFPWKLTCSAFRGMLCSLLNHLRF